MKFKHKYRLITLLLLLTLFCVSFTAAAQIPARPHNYVTDLAGIVDDGTESRLNAYLHELERKTTVQLAVLTIAGLDGASIEDLSLQVAHEKWKLGQKGKDNGVLLLVALTDRKYRIEVGYGLEGLLPDSLVGSIGRQLLAPYFRKGNFSRGIYEAVLSMAGTVAADAGVQISGMPPAQRPAYTVKKSKSPSLLRSIISILFFIFMVIMFIRHPRLFLFLLLMSGMGGRRSAWGGGGGGFGGGGGGFGGGGASGGW